MNASLLREMCGNVLRMFIFNDNAGKKTLRVFRSENYISSHKHIKPPLNNINNVSS